MLLLIYQWKLGKFNLILLNDLILDVISEYTDYDLPANILNLKIAKSDSFHKNQTILFFRQPISRENV